MYVYVIYIYIHIHTYNPIVIAINDTTIYRYLADWVLQFAIGSSEQLIRPRTRCRSRCLWLLNMAMENG